MGHWPLALTTIPSCLPRSEKWQYLLGVMSFSAGGVEVGVEMAEVVWGQEMASVSLCHLAHNTPPHSQNNLSNPPTPPSSLPPTPPPSVQQKMVNGVTPSEELGEHPKDATSARDAEGTLRGKSGAEWASPSLVGFGGWGPSQLVCHSTQFEIRAVACCPGCTHDGAPEKERPLQHSWVGSQDGLQWGRMAARELMKLLMRSSQTLVGIELQSGLDLNTVSHIHLAVLLQPSNTTDG